MDKEFDCVVCGTCVLDLLVRPVPLRDPLGPIGLVHTEGVEVSPGGVVGNCGIALARLGMRTAALSYVGDDPWAAVLRERLEAEGVDTRRLLTHPTEPTATTVALIDDR